MTDQILLLDKVSSKILPALKSSCSEASSSSRGGVRRAADEDDTAGDNNDDDDVGSVLSAAQKRRARQISKKRNRENNRKVCNKENNNSNIVVDQQQQRQQQSFLRILSTKLHGAWKDIKTTTSKSRNSNTTTTTTIIVPTFHSNRVMDFIDSIVSLSCCLLFFQFDFDMLKNQPTILFIAILCYFHVLCFWMNLQHLFKFTNGRPDDGGGYFTLWQTWILILVCLGLVLYPFSLAAWIDGITENDNDNDDLNNNNNKIHGDNRFYFIINVFILIMIIILVSSLKQRNGNALYRIYSTFAPILGVIYYGIALVIRLLCYDEDNNDNRIWGPAEIMAIIAPFFFMVPLGSYIQQQQQPQQRQDYDKEKEEIHTHSSTKHDIERGATTTTIDEGSNELTKNEYQREDNYYGGGERVGAWTHHDEDNNNNDEEDLLASVTSYRELFRMALKDIRKGDILSSYSMDRTMDFFGDFIALSTVFLFLELGWHDIYNFLNNPKPVLIAGLCYFHSYVYYVNIFHLTSHTKARTPGGKISALQRWLMIISILCIIMYPLSMSGLINDGDEDGNNEEGNRLYLWINISICLVYTIWTYITPIEDDANDLYWVYCRIGMPLAFVWYCIALVLDYAGHDQAADCMAYIAPFCFAIPLGGSKKDKRV